MISDIEYTKKSLGLHLFFMRIMKEHSFFLQIGFMSRDANFVNYANNLRMSLDRLFADVIALSNGVVSDDILKSGEVVTPYTLRTEIVSANFTGINIPTELTRAEYNLSSGNFKGSVNPALVKRTFVVNEKALELVSSLIQFKTAILNNMLNCKMLTVNYPLLIEHIRREAILYRKMIKSLQRREDPDLLQSPLEQEAFWNQIMAEHSKFIRGLLDPSEDALFDIANSFGKEFDELTEKAKNAMEKTLPEVTKESLDATIEIKQFKTQATEGLLDCKIRAIATPLLADHVLREANHYLRLLKEFKK